MRALTFIMILVGITNHVAVNAQAPDAGMDFSGIYAPPVFVATIAVIEPDVYPFTAEGKRSFDAYDPLVLSPNQADDCTPDLMPGILWSNSPMQIREENRQIAIRYERGNTVRSIPLEGPAASSDQTHSELGYSVGRWVGDVLTIETTHMTSDVVRNNRGYPISERAQVTERYWREPGANNLHMELIVNDPTNYTDTFSLSREWVWAPDEELQEYECISLGPRGGEPDIDELVQMLEAL